MPFILLALLLLCAQAARTGEVDDFILHKSDLPPSASSEVDRIVNDNLAAFTAFFNADLFASCDHQSLVKRAAYFFDRNVPRIALTLYDAAYGEKVFPQDVMGKPLPGGKPYSISTLAARKDSIYSGTKVRSCCSDVLNIEGQPIGLDKIDHMFGNGGLLWARYEAMSERERSVPGAIHRLNANQEQGTWGLFHFVSGVKSYGDLAANWSGFQFYRELFDGPQPYLRCSGGKLAINRKFKISRYVSKAWTESANCSAFATREIATRVAANVAKRGLSCPMRSSDCAEIIALYKSDPFALQTIVSPTCKGRRFEDSVEVETPWDWARFDEAVTQSVQSAATVLNHAAEKKLESLKSKTGPGGVAQ